jgi:predicted PolB exonuclease-like 3'-5' exonuclease
MEKNKINKVLQCQQSDCVHVVKIVEMDDEENYVISKNWKNFRVSENH